MDALRITIDWPVFIANMIFLVALLFLCRWLYKTGKKKLLSIIVLSVLLIAVIFYLSNREDQEDLITKGNIIVQRVEDFKERRGRLPESLAEMGIEPGNFFYLKSDSANYMIWCGSLQRESVKYFSETKAWETARPSK
jgi:hypothetical protein